uniref:Uncharacterized protein n=1 Tax=Anopheles atroparvus TaxID=41427 RepID=A0AAG5D2E3_ANOAO
IKHEEEVKYSKIPRILAESLFVVLCHLTVRGFNVVVTKISAFEDERDVIVVVSCLYTCKVTDCDYFSDKSAKSLQLNH